ncbi:mitochondrial export translocase Oxa1 [Plectosphaerella plurivora]|uniref:Mitochondrial export translocase Oxa1 n=1 Tax=Plectosphaerella plurivora TaxID=936078 RepID=A0A9P8VJ26_9PEZI|nr:mitochondrial export translocase Oxa1 [Plectosphaerella plurivora]
MLPSRGAIRSLSSARTGLSSPSIRTTTPRLLDGRRFGTSTRLPVTGLKPQAGMRPIILRSPMLLAGSIPASRALSFWSKDTPKTPEPTPAAPVATPEAAIVQEAPATAAAAPSSVVPPTPTPTPIDAPPAPLSDITPNLTLSDFEALGVNISDIPEQIGYLKALGLDFGWGPSSCVQWLLEHVYIYTGLPWWAAIMTTTVLLRLALLQPSLKAQQTSAKMQELQAMPEYNALKAKMQSSLKSGDQVAMNESRLALSTLHKQNNVSPLSSLWGLAQIPFGYGAFIVLNNMAKIPVPSMETGGILWFHDLTVADPFYVLPILGPIAMVGMFYSNMANVPAQTQAQMKLMAYILTPISALVAMWLPAGLQFYFVISTLLAVAQNVLFRNSVFRRLTGLPTLKSAVPPTSTPHISGALYQAPTRRDPNTIPVKAVEESAPKENVFSSGMTSIKQTIHNAKGGMGDHLETSKKEQSEKDMKAWEEKRAEEDRRRYGSRKAKNNTRKGR